MENVLPVETNIIIFSLNGRFTPQSLVAKLKEDNILGYAISPTQVRLVLHLDITPAMVQKTIGVIRQSLDKLITECFQRSIPQRLQPGKNWKGMQTNEAGSYEGSF